MTVAQIANVVGKHCKFQTNLVNRRKPLTNLTTLTVKFVDLVKLRLVNSWRIITKFGHILANI